MSARAPFYYRRLTMTEQTRFHSDFDWGVFERGEDNGVEKLTSAWPTRDAAREAARQLNTEEP